MLLLYWLGWTSVWFDWLHVVEWRTVSFHFLIVYSWNQVMLGNSVENPRTSVIFCQDMRLESSALLQKSLMHFVPHLVAMSSVFFSLHWFLSDLLSNYSQARLQAAKRRRDLCRLNAQDPLMNHFPLHVNSRLLIHTDDKCEPIQMHGYRTKS